MFNVNVFEVSGRQVMYIKELKKSFFINKSILRNGIRKYSKEELLSVISNIGVKENYLYHLRKRIIEYSGIKYVSNYKKKGHIQYTLCMHPSRKCNLACKYCFAKNEEGKELPNKRIDFEMAKRAIDFMVDVYGREGFKYRIDISGSGEPLLNLDFIKKLDKYCSEKSSETGKEIKMMFPTNATLIDDETAHFLNQCENLFLGVSIDGNSEQSVNRCYLSGVSAFDKIIAGMKKINRTYGLAVTITNCNEDVDVIFDYLYNNFPNADAISMQFVRNYDVKDKLSFWNINEDNLLLNYEKLIKNVIKQIDNGNFDYCYSLVRGSDVLGGFFLKIVNGKRVQLRHCGAGMNIITVDDRGDLYACSVFNGNKNFKVGDIFSGVSESKQGLYEKNSILENEKCKECWCSDICSGECMAQSYTANGKINVPIDKLCRIKERLIELALYLNTYLIEYNPKAYSIIKKFRVDETLFDDSLWTINYFLRSNGVNVKYNDLERDIVRNIYGIKPNKMMEYLKSRGIKMSFKRIMKEDDLKNISFPAIAVVKNKYRHQYIIIDEYKEKQFKVKYINNMYEGERMDFETLMRNIYKDIMVFG